jgi:hypothetical protein
MQQSWPNKITGPNAGGPRQFPIRTPLAARVGQFWRSAAAAAESEIKRARWTVWRRWTVGTPNKSLERMRAGATRSLDHSDALGAPALIAQFGRWAADHAPANIEHETQTT